MKGRLTTIRKPGNLPNFEHQCFRKKNDWHETDTTYIIFDFWDCIFPE